MSFRRALVFLAAAVAACDDKPKPVPAPPEPSALTPALPSSLAEVLGLDGGELTLEVDPPAPPGDLKTDLDRFVNVETCVTERANLDPLVADALRGIGYDTFLHDACRLLEASKDRKRETCDKIDASALRRRCQAQVAMLAQTPDACPLLLDGMPERGRFPECVAVAARDVRLCGAELRGQARATCEAMVLKDDGKCAGLAPSERAACVREITRWRTSLSAPLEGLPALPPTHAHLKLANDAGPEDDVDLGPEVARGVVLVTAHDRGRVEIGSLGESDLARIAVVPTKRARAGLALTFDPPALDRLEVHVGGDSPLVTPVARCDCKVKDAKLERARGGALTFTLEGTLSSGTRSYGITFEVSTFVRDVVEAPRALAPLHPVVPGGVSSTAP